MQEAADDLVKLYKRVSLDDDLDDTLRGQLLSQLTAGASLTAGTLRLVTDTGHGHDMGPHGQHKLHHGEEHPAHPGHNTNSPNSQPQLSANPYFQVHEHSSQHYHYKLSY